MLILWLLSLAQASKESCQRAFITDPFQNSNDEGLLRVLYSGKDINDLGHYTSCVRQANSSYYLAKTMFETFPLYIGLCVPKECDIEYLREVVNLTSSYTQGLEIEIQAVSEHPITPGAAVMIALICLLILLALTGTYLDMNESKPVEKTDIELKEIQQTDRETSKERGWAYQALLCFSIKRTFNALAAFSIRDNSKVLNGPRFMSMCWVCLGHVYLVRISFPTQNIYDLQEIFSWDTTLVALIGVYAVDTFFWLSGFVLGYLTLREMYNKKGKLPWGLVIILRALRILPAYAFMIGFSMFLLPVLSSGPKSMMKVDLDTGCDQYWWTNLLFLNNMIPDGKGNGCFGQGWYLANDMQMFLFSLIVIYVYYNFSYILSWGFMLVLQAGEIAIRLSLAVEYGFSISQFAENDSGDAFFSYMYTKPYCRYAPYLAGLGCGFIYLRYKGISKEDPIADKIIALFKKGGFLCFIAGFFLFELQVWIHRVANHDTENNFQGFSKGFNTFYVSIDPLYIATCYFLLFFTMLIGKGSFVASFMGWEGWSPLSKITFSSYLVNITMTRWYLANDDYSFVWNGTNMFVDVLFCVMMSFVCGLLLFFLVESPANDILKMTMKSPPRKPQQVALIGKSESEKV